MGRTSTARERLIAAMGDLVHRKGYAAVGVDQVCRAAGVKKGSFYHFFRSKRELMLAALDQRWQLACDHVMTRAFQPDLPPLQRIERLFSIIADFETANRKAGGAVLGCPFGNIAAEVGLTEPSIASRADDAFSAMAAFVRNALTEAKSRGELGRDLRVAETADAAIAYFEGLSLLAKTRNDPGLIRRLGPRVVQLARQPAGSSPRRKQSRRP
jgi:TetR/AcrR family transcriptional repressor of nem operon